MNHCPRWLARTNAIVAMYSNASGLSPSDVRSYTRLTSTLSFAVPAAVSSASYFGSAIVHWIDLNIDLFSCSFNDSMLTFGNTLRTASGSSASYAAQYFFRTVLITPFANSSSLGGGFTSAGGVWGA